MAGGGCTKSPVDDLKPSVGVFEASGVPKIIEVLGSGESVKIQIRPLSVQNTSVPESAFVSVVRHHLDGKRKVDRRKIEKRPTHQGHGEETFLGVKSYHYQRNNLQVMSRACSNSHQG